MTTPLNNSNQFSGFSVPQYTLIPKVLVDKLMQGLSKGELRCILYIMSHTYGWKKDSDFISLNQFLDGIKKSNGDILDNGVGLSKNTLLKSLNNLERLNLIKRTRRKIANNNNLPTEFSLNLLDFKNTPKNNTRWIRSDFFQFPENILSRELINLSAKHLKVLLFVARWTSHIESHQTQISLKQMQNGVFNKAGEMLGEGCGIKDKSDLSKTIKFLLDNNFIFKEQRFHQSNGCAPSLYSLYPISDLDDDTPIGESNPTPIGVFEPSTIGIFTPRIVEKDTTTPVGNFEPRVVGEIEPHNINTKTKDNLNTTSADIVKYFYKCFGKKVSTTKIKREEGLISNLLEEDFTEDEVMFSCKWLAKNYPDTVHINRLPMLIHEAVRAFKKEKDKTKRTEKDKLREQLVEKEAHKAKIAILKFEGLDVETQSLWIKKAPAILQSEFMKKRWAALEYYKNS